MKKEELTNEQLRECQQVWIEIKELYLKGAFIGLCTTLDEVLENRGSTTRLYNILTEALERHKPEGKEPGDFWWPWSDTKSRLKVLNKLIEEFSTH